MRIDFSQIPLKNRAFSNKPMSFCDPDAKTCLSAVIDLVAIETGNRTAREYWQTTQLRNLLAIDGTQITALYEAVPEAGLATCGSQLHARTGRAQLSSSGAPLLSVTTGGGGASASTAIDAALTRAFCSR